MFCPVFIGGTACHFLEYPAEILAVCDAYALRYLEDLHVCLRKQFFCLFYIEVY